MKFNTPFRDEQAILTALESIAPIIGKQEEFNEFVRELNDHGYRITVDESEADRIPSAPEWLKQMFNPLLGLYQSGFNDGRNFTHAYSASTAEDAHDAFVGIQSTNLRVIVTD